MSRIEILRSRCRCGTEGANRVDGREPHDGPLCACEPRQDWRCARGPRSAEETRNRGALVRSKACVAQRSCQRLDGAPVRGCGVQERSRCVERLIANERARVRRELEHDGERVARSRAGERVERGGGGERTAPHGERRSPEPGPAREARRVPTLRSPPLTEPDGRSSADATSGTAAAPAVTSASRAGVRSSPPPESSPCRASRRARVRRPRSRSARAQRWRLAAGRGCDRWRAAQRSRRRPSRAAFRARRGLRGERRRRCRAAAVAALASRADRRGPRARARPRPARPAPSPPPCPTSGTTARSSPSLARERTITARTSGLGSSSFPSRGGTASGRPA